MTGRLAYRKVLGTKNPADVLTKHVPADLLQKHLETLGVEFRGGRAESAPELNNIESVVLEVSPAEEPGLRPKKKVSFAAKIQCRAIPSENKGRKCRGQARKKLEGRWEKRSLDSGGSNPCSGSGIHTSETSGNGGPCLSGKAHWCGPQLECPQVSSILCESW